MNLYLVRLSRGEEIAVAAEDVVNGHLYIYVENTGSFHRDDPMGVDFFYDRDNSYEPIGAAVAEDKIRAGLGHIDERRAKWLAEEYRSDPPERRRTVEEVLTRPVAVSPQAHARQKLLELEAADPGVWVTYKVYRRDQIQTARVAASDIRTGKVKAFKGATVETRVVTSDEALELWIRRATAGDKTNA